MLAVFFGRSTAFLRAVVPTAAGAACMSPTRFLLWNVIGGMAWGTGFSLLGYFAGESYQAALRLAGRGSIAVTVLIAVLLAGYWIKRVLVRRLTHVAEQEPPED